MKYLKQVLRLEGHAASAAHYWPMAGVLTFLMLADVRVRVTIELTEYALVVALTSVPDARSISQCTLQTLTSLQS